MHITLICYSKKAIDKFYDKKLSKKSFANLRARSILKFVYVFRKFFCMIFYVLSTEHNWCKLPGKTRRSVVVT